MSAVRIPAFAWPAACAAAALVPLAGCSVDTGSEKIVNSDTVKPVIDKQVDQAGGPAAKSIDCPDTEAKAGKTLTCHVTLEDGTAYDDTIRIDKVGKEHPLLTIVAAKLVTVGSSTAKPLIDQQLKDINAPAAKSIDCTNVAAKVGNTFTCKVTVADGHVITDELRILKLKASAAPTLQIHTTNVK